MKQVFQIIFCICSALCVVAAFFLGVFFGFIYVLVGACGALFFLCMTLLMKNGNPFRREKAEPKPDFMRTAEENEKILKEKSESSSETKE